MCDKFGFSIIIPMYNSELYILDTLKSIIDNEYDNYEVIIVDDGSIDSSNNIVKSYINENNFDNFKLLKQKNQGPNVARNYALEYARYKYILFIDADDLFTKNALDILSFYVKNNDFDFISFGVGFFDNKTKSTISVKKSENEILTGSSIIESSFYSNKIQGISWNKCYRLNFLNDNKIRFYPDKVHGRDILFSRQCSFYASNVQVISDVLILSRYHELSFSRNFSRRNIESCLDLCEKHNYFFKGKVNDNMLNHFYNKHINYIYGLSLFRFDNFNDFYLSYKLLKDAKNKYSCNYWSFLSNLKVLVLNFSFNSPRLSWGICRVLLKLGVKPY
ncbi:TPA: glycosyltransferase [Photobacterium damselae]